MASNNSTQAAIVLFKDGYDIPLYGLDNGMFYYVHVTAIVCLTVSLTCALFTIISSFWSHPAGEFYTGWTKGERLVIYMSICDLLLNMSLLMNHLHILISKTHTRPKELCSFYGFIMTEFVLAQILMVNVVAINVFTTMFFSTNYSFGRFDSGILLWSFGVPFIGGLIAAMRDQFGPIEIVCFFDAINGRVASLVLITIPTTAIMVVNLLLYILTFIKIRIDVKDIRQSLGNMASTAGRHIRAARNMSMFVVAFFVQWSSIVLSGVWLMFADDIADVPEVLKTIVGISTNLGGVLNMIVYLAVFKKSRKIKHISNMATRMEPQVTHGQRKQQRIC
ncbi:hypothetical protein MAR_005269 [Mya arenaria]|uniref:G-protein coupled receptors family 1 profile domain-containing protein n=1 Tax=Mya arenaria TaxID=6604 RepID=A0ABY7F1F2_MYAAR|nr:hypothetical protein MAR_005269 [Mya arenaria]